MARMFKTPHTVLVAGKEGQRQPLREESGRSKSKMFSRGRKLDLGWQRVTSWNSFDQ
jgi:hypothetical protein